MTTWGNITFFRGYDLPVVKTRIFANSLKNMVPIVTNSQTGSLIKNRTRNCPNEIVPNEKSRITSNFCDSLTAVLKTLNILFLYRFGQSFMFQLAACMNSAPYDKCQSGYWQSGCIADKYVSTMQLADKVKPL